MRPSIGSSPSGLPASRPESAHRTCLGAMSSGKPFQGGDWTRGLSCPCVAASGPSGPAQLPHPGPSPTASRLHINRSTPDQLAWVVEPGGEGPDDLQEVVGLEVASRSAAMAAVSRKLPVEVVEEGDRRADGVRRPGAVTRRWGCPARGRPPGWRAGRRWQSGAPRSQSLWWGASARSSASTLAILRSRVWAVLAPSTDSTYLR